MVWNNERSGCALTGYKLCQQEPCRLDSLWELECCAQMWLSPCPLSCIPCHGKPVQPREVGMGWERVITQVILVLGCRKKRWSGFLAEQSTFGPVTCEPELHKNLL